MSLKFLKIFVILSWGCAIFALFAGAARAELPAPLEGQRAPDLLLLANSEVPAGVELAREYAKMSSLPGNALLELALPVAEELSQEQYADQLRKPLLERLRARPEGFPGQILCFYGVPIFVSCEGRLRAVDRLLSLLRREGKLDGRVVQNPYWHREVIARADLPILVCRLDGSTAAAARGQLESWRRHRLFGPWLRYVADSGSAEAAVIRQAGLLQADAAALADLSVMEIQMLLASREKLLAFASAQSGRRLTEGAVVLINDNGKESPEHRPFRSEGEGPAATASLLGAAFYVGLEGQRSSEFEDYFDAAHFLERWFAGESFAEAAHGALAHLGGATLILGDPLARPFGQEALAGYKRLYEEGGLKGDEAALAARYDVMKEGWFLHGILADWQQGRMDLAIGKLRGAALLRRSRPLFLETLCDLLFQAGRDEMLRETLRAWRPETRSPYQERMARFYNERLSERLGAEKNGLDDKAAPLK